MTVDIRLNGGAVTERVEVIVRTDLPRFSTWIRFSN
jgi:hypothetical protein